jgi:hypothetical protein
LQKAGGLIGHRERLSFVTMHEDEHCSARADRPEESPRLSELINKRPYRWQMEWPSFDFDLRGTYTQNPGLLNAKILP